MVMCLGGFLSLFYLCTVWEVRMENAAHVLEAKYQHALDESLGRPVEPLPEKDADILAMRKTSVIEEA